MLTYIALAENPGAPEKPTCPPGAGGLGGGLGDDSECDGSEGIILFFPQMVFCYQNFSNLMSKYSKGSSINYVVSRGEGGLKIANFT